MRLFTNVIGLALVLNNILYSFPIKFGQGKSFSFGQVKSKDFDKVNPVGFLGIAAGSVMSSIGTSFDSAITKKEKETDKDNPVNIIAGGLGSAFGAVGKSVTAATKAKFGNEKATKAEVVGGVAGVAFGTAAGKTLKTIINGEVTKQSTPKPKENVIVKDGAIDYDDDKL
ncbi:hypothetical protein K502DRAFT_330510 [Neoconidiobolus thromboides FSU 785]|nr:hypothetical protein K502DRAFT_330510 [Neoconidiobolus thromboides FSU 785]